MKTQLLIDALGYIDDDLISGAVEYQRKPFAARRSRHTVLKIAAAMIAVLLLGTVTAYALGYDLWGAIGRWTAETFHFEIHSETTETRLDPEVKAGLAERGIPENLVPTLRLEGFELIQQEFLGNNYCDIFLLAYQDENERYYSVTVERCFSEAYAEKATFEKDDAPVEEYVSGERKFYIFSNGYGSTTTAAWSDGVFLVDIVSNLTTVEVKAIIDSIGA